MTARTFTAKPATRQGSDTPLLTGLEGPPGGGKTYSALRLATGMRQVRGGKIKLIDTEGNRALAYADSFEFDHVPFDPPYRSTDFLDAIQQQLADNPACIITDSMSDEHEGEGGCLDWHDEEIDRMLGIDKDNWSRRDAMNQAGWIKPKRARLKMINSLMRIKVPLIFCFRAREKTKPMKQQRGNREVTVPTNMGFQPICPAEIASSMTLMCLLPTRSDGVPVWKSNTVSEDFFFKLPEYLRPFITEGQPLSEDMGAAFARWAKGDTISPSGRLATGAPSVSADPTGGAPTEDANIPELDKQLTKAAERGTAELSKVWSGLSSHEHSMLKAALDRRHKPRALEVDAKADDVASWQRG